MTNEIENTRFIMHNALSAMRKARKHPTMLRAFEDALEEHLEALRREAEAQQAKRQDALDSGSAALDRLRQMTEERDQIQQRLHAIDHAYCEQSNLVTKQAREIESLKTVSRIAGDALIRAQTIARQHLDDCRSAEKLSDEFSEKLTHATMVIGQQEQLIAGQRAAIVELYMERAVFKKRGCTHEFLPAFQGGERCVYCCEPR